MPPPPLLRGKEDPIGAIIVLGLLPIAACVVVPRGVLLRLRLRSNAAAVPLLPLAPKELPSRN